MYTITFVCLGNICRSPMAEFMFKKMLKDGGMSEYIQVKSAATSFEEEGNSIYLPARRALSAHGIPYGEHYATPLKKEDFYDSDLFLCMDKNNLRAMNRIFGRTEKQMLLLSLTENEREVADPWYTGDFERTYRDIKEGLDGLLEYLQKNGVCPIKK